MESVKVDPDDSPDFFVQKNNKGRGVRRLNKIPLVLAGLVVVAIVTGITYAFYLQEQQNKIKATESKLPVVDEMKIPLKPAGNDYVQANMPEPPAPPAVEPTPIKPSEPKVETKIVEVPQKPEEVDPEEEARRQLALRIQQKRMAQEEAALSAESGVAATGNDHGGNGGGADNRGTGVGAGSRPQENDFGDNDPNMQGQKIAFLAQSPEADVYLNKTRQNAIKPQLEVKAGTIIPSVLISGINSDLPGMITAQVRESVYDSAYGQNVLIPVGSRLVGKYDSHVAMGQRRALIVWQRIIYPDSSSLSLDNMPGADQSGYAGFNDKVDNHYMRIFGNALMLSVISAASQLSQNDDDDSSHSDKTSAKDMLAAELGRQWGEVGTEMTRRNLDIQPTLKIRPGYLFNVMVTKDIILPKWRGHPLAAGGIQE